MDACKKSFGDSPLRKKDLGSNPIASAIKKKLINGYGENITA